MDLLNIENLSISFFSEKGEAKVIRNVSLNIKKSEVVGLVGESGCGKTLTALSILKLIPYPGKITSGTIYFNNANLLLMKEEELQKIRGNKITMIFQEPMTSLNPVFKIGFQIEEVFRYHTDLSKKEIREKVLMLLHKVRIPDAETIYNYYPHQLSGGMRQRIMIAMAIALNPDLIIADEPTTALDVTVQAQILKLLLNLKEEFSSSIFFITHDFGVISEIADRVYVMYAGEIVEIADKNELFENPLHPYTKALLEAIPGYKGNFKKLKPIPGTLPDINNLPPGCAFYERCQYKEENCMSKINLKKYSKGHYYRCIL